MRSLSKEDHQAALLRILFESCSRNRLDPYVTQRLRDRVLTIPLGIPHERAIRVAIQAGHDEFRRCLTRCDAQDLADQYRRHYAEVVGRPPPEDTDAPADRTPARSPLAAD